MLHGGRKTVYLFEDFFAFGSWQIVCGAADGAHGSPTATVFSFYL